MRFDATASERLIPASEKQEMPACLPVVSLFTGVERAAMAAQELKSEFAGMWAELRNNGGMVVDFPARKVGMPWAVPFEGVCFPVEVDGESVLVLIPVDQVARFALALMETIPESKKLDSECEAEMAAQEQQSVGAT